MDLHQLLEDASRRPAGYDPGLDGLLRTARRRGRTRIAITAAAASVALVTGGTVAWVNRTGPAVPAVSTPTVSPTSVLPTSASAFPAGPSAEDLRILRECSKQPDTSSESLPTHDFRRWTVGVSATDGSGTSAVLLSPDRRRYALCGFSRPGWSGGGESVVYIDQMRTVALPRGWRSGFAPINWAHDCKGKGVTGCKHELWAGSGLLPRGVARVTVGTWDGHTGDAVVRNGLMAYRHVAPYKPIIGGKDLGSGSASSPPVVLTLYDAVGRKLSSFNQNYLPPIPPGTCPETGGC